MTVSLLLTKHIFVKLCENLDNARFRPFSIVAPSEKRRHGSLELYVYLLIKPFKGV